MEGAQECLSSDVFRVLERYMSQMHLELDVISIIIYFYDILLMYCMCSNIFLTCLLIGLRAC